MMLDAAPTDLTGKTCLITGVAGGIGKATADHFAALGARVVGTDRGAGPEGLDDYRAFDLLDPAGLQACVDWVDDCAPDVVFNNAGLFDMGGVLDADLDQYERMFGLNVRAAFAVMQAAARAMVRDDKKGSIINLSSQAGHRGEALVTHYCAAKAAIISYTQSAALALAPHGIRVNAISPGVIDTPMWDVVDGLFARFEGKAPGQKKREVGEAVPLGYMGSPADVARMAVFLASDQSSYVTAQTMCVDGGNVLR